MSGNHPSQSIQRRNRGFTLIELMITLAVAAILLMIAVPSFKHILNSTHLAGVSNDLSGDLQYARTLAVSRQMDAAVAASAGGWQDGWNVEVVSGSTVTIIRTHPAVASQYVVNGGSATKVTFQSQGSLKDPANAFGTCFTVYAPNGEHNDPLFLQILPPGMLAQSSGSPTPSGCTAP